MRCVSFKGQFYIGVETKKDKMFWLEKKLRDLYSSLEKGYRRVIIGYQ